MVELRTRNRQMRGDGTNHHEKLEHKQMWCASRFTIPNTAGTSPDPACNNTNMRSSYPNQVSCTHDFSYPHISSSSFSSSSPISLCLIHNSTIITEQKVRSSLSISPCHDHELMLSTSIHRVQYPPTTPSTDYRIHRKVFSFYSFS